MYEIFLLENVEEWLSSAFFSLMGSQVRYFFIFQELECWIVIIITIVVIIVILFS